MVEIKNLSKEIGSPSKEAFRLSNINMEIPKGFITGLIGENGAGKTSLIRILMNLYHKDSGELRMFGTDYETDEKMIKDEIGYVLNEDIFIEQMLVKDHAKVYGKYYSRFSYEKFVKLAGEYGIDIDKKIKMLSKGERLKLQFVFALSHDPKLLLLDEPTANFDPKFRERFLKELCEFVKDGEHSVLLATHLTSDLDRIADYIVYIEKGQIKFSMDKESLIDKYAMVKGSNVKVKCLKPEKVIYKEENEFGSKALVYRERLGDNLLNLTIENPTIEEIMYGIVKGEKNA